MCLIPTTNKLVEAGETASGILQVVYGVDLAKALDPLKARDYQRIVRRLGASLRKANAGAEAAALREALNRLDVDWANISAAQRNAVVQAATESFASVPKNVLPKMGESLKGAGSQTVKGTKRSANTTYRLNLDVNFSATDKLVSEAMGKQQINFIRDEYGRRRAGFSRKARSIVGDGLDQGLGRKEIAEDLAKQLTTSTLNRNRWYWELISSTFTQRARTYGQLSSFTEAEIVRFTFEAVLDEATSEICRYMDQRTFEVRQALGVYEEMQSLKDPEDVKFAAPWVSTSRDEEGNAILAFKQPDGSKQQVARIESPGLGSQRTGTYSQGMLDSELARNGIMMPPLHGYCRSTILPDI